MMESVHVVPEGSQPASDQRVGPTPQKKSHLPDWVSVDGLGSWDQLVEEVQVWPTVVQHVDAGQVLLVRRPVLLVVVEGVGAEFESLVRQIDDSLANVDWSEVPTEKLVALLRRFAWAEAGVRCLAELSPKDSPQDEVEQFYDMLLIRGVLEEAGGQLRDGEDALDLARFAAIGHLAIRHVARELVRRGKGHKPGVAAAILLGLPVDSELPSLDGAQEWALGYMLMCIRRSFPKTVLAHGDPADAGEEAPDLSSQVLLTLSEPARCKADVLERIVDALEGRMDVAPRAIHDRLARHQEGRREKRSLEVQFEIRLTEDGEDEVVEPVDPSASSETRVITRETRDAIVRLAGGYPSLPSYVTARLKGENQKTAAASAGITARTARTYDNELRDLLGDWL